MLIFAPTMRQLSTGKRTSDVTPHVREKEKKARALESQLCVPRGALTFSSVPLYSHHVLVPRSHGVSLSREMTSGASSAPRPRAPRIFLRPTDALLDGERDDDTRSAVPSSTMVELKEWFPAGKT